MHILCFRENNSGQSPAVPEMTVSRSRPRPCSMSVFSPWSISWSATGSNRERWFGFCERRCAYIEASLTTMIACRMILIVARYFACRMLMLVALSPPPFRARRCSSCSRVAPPLFSAEPTAAAAAVVVRQGRPVSRRSASDYGALDDPSPCGQRHRWW